MPPIKKEFPYILLWLALLWLHPPAPATGQNKAEALALAKKGVRHFRRENYPQALDHFNRALAADSANVRALFYGGITNQLLFSNQEAIDHLLRSYALNPKFDKHYYYWLGRAYHVNLQFDRAIEAYRSYLETLSPRDSRQNS
ncbi:MAG: hypothetical protein ICV83_21635, partial [Cytophagales bacterium]|nr:hypothetical protein [Cytophagales bacterium]